MKNLHQLKSGDKFGRLTVIKLIDIKTKIIYRKDRNKEVKEYKYYYLCKCDCGNECIVEKYHLITGHTKSCGCYNKERIIESHTTHNLRHTNLYRTWSHIKSRCYNNKVKCYKNYGGRGITMCEEWKQDFKSFYDWAINNGYREDLSIDRIDNNGNYEPSNCRWVDRLIQANNTRRNHFIEYKDNRYTIAELSRLLNIDYNILYSRIKKQLFN